MQTFEVIISYDIDADDKSFYKHIHGPLSNEYRFEPISKSTYKFLSSLTDVQIEDLVKRIRMLFVATTDKPYGNKSVIKLIIARERTFEIETIV